MKVIGAKISSKFYAIFSSKQMKFQILSAGILNFPSLYNHMSVPNSW